MVVISCCVVERFICNNYPLRLPALVLQFSWWFIFISAQRRMLFHWPFNLLLFLKNCRARIYWAFWAPNALRPTGITVKCSQRAISEDKQNVWLDKPKPTHLTWLDNGVRTEAEYMNAACGSAVVWGVWVCLSTLWFGDKFVPRC